MKTNLNTDKPKVRKEPNAVFFGHFMNPAKVDPVNSPMWFNKKHPMGMKNLLFHSVPFGPLPVLTT